MKKLKVKTAKIMLEDSFDDQAAAVDRNSACSPAGGVPESPILKKLKASAKGKKSSSSAAERALGARGEELVGTSVARRLHEQAKLTGATQFKKAASGIREFEQESTSEHEQDLHLLRH